MKSAFAQHIQVCVNVLPRHVAFSIFCSLRQSKIECACSTAFMWKFDCFVRPVKCECKCSTLCGLCWQTDQVRILTHVCVCRPLPCHEFPRWVVHISLHLSHVFQPHSDHLLHREHLICQLIPCLWTIGSPQSHTAPRLILAFCQLEWWLVYLAEFHCSSVSKMLNLPPLSVVGLQLHFLSAVRLPSDVAIDDAACYNIWLQRLCMCNLSPHASQPSNKSRVSILWHFHIVLDWSSSKTSRIPTKDVYQLSMVTLDQSSCRHCRQRRLRR